MPGPLNGITVLEVGDGIAAGYCGRVLAGFGATVVKVEPAAGSAQRRARVVPGAPLPDQEAAPLFTYLGMGKRSLGGASTGKLSGLASLAEVVIVDAESRDALSYDALSLVNPRLVYVSLSAFGDWGPFAGWKAENINAFAMGGQMSLTGEPGREPLCTGGEQAWMQLGLHGFAATCFALLGVRRGGLGQRLELSAVECMAGALEGFGPNARYLGVHQGRSGRARFATMGIYPCQDGYAGVYGTNRQLPLLSRIAGRPAVGDDPRFQSLGGMLQNNDELTDFVTSYVEPLTRADVRRIARQSGMTMAPVETLGDVAASEHLAARGFFETLPTPSGATVTVPGRPFVMKGTPWQSRPAPALGECSPEAAAAIFANGQKPTVEAAHPVPRDRDERGLLAGVRVLDFTAYWAGPYATKWLADFGADVVKVESPALADFIRSTTVDPGHERPYDNSAYFNNYSRGKKSLTLDPVNPLGRELLLKMLPNFDVVVENFKAGRMVNIGLGYEELRKVKPDIVMVSVSGYGQDGPDSSLAGVGTNMEQLSGLCSLNLYSDSPQPYNTGIAYGDPTSGTTGAAAVAMALLHRDRTGEGQYVEISGHETIISLFGEQFAARSLGVEPAPKGNRHADMVPHGCYPCAGDDSWLTVAVRTDEQWAALCSIIGREDLALEYPDFEPRREHELDIDAAIMGWTVGMEPYEAATRLQQAGIAAAPVLRPLDQPLDPALRLRGYFVSVEHPDQGRWPHDGIAWRFSRTPGAIAGPAPLFGQHTRAILAAELNLMPAEIDTVYAARAASDTPFRR